MSSLTPLLPPTLGHVRVPGDGHRGRGDSALHVQGLLQPGGGVLVPAGQTQSLQLQLVQRLRPGTDPVLMTDSCELGHLKDRCVHWSSVHQADVQEVSGQTYIVFGVILFFWELLPTSLVVVFFRVQRPNQNLVKQGAKQHDLWNLMSALCINVSGRPPPGPRRDDQQPQFQLQSLFLRQPSALRQR